MFKAIIKSKNLIPSSSQHQVKSKILPPISFNSKVSSLNFSFSSLHFIMNLLAFKYLLTLYFFLNAFINFCSGRRRNIKKDEGADVMISCNVDISQEDDIDLSVVWKKDDVTLKLHDNPHYYYHSNNASLVIKQITVNDIGSYQCFADTDSGPIGEPTHLQVKEKLKFVDPQIDKKLELSSVSKLSCKTRGHLTPTVYWEKNGLKRLPGHITQKNGTLIFNGVLSTDAGKYTCFASDSVTSIQTTVNVEVGRAPKFTHTPPKQLEVTSGSTVLLECRAEGDPLPIIHWDKNKMRDFTDDRVKTFPNGSLVIFDATPIDQARYGCIAGNLKGFERAEVDLVVKISELSEHESEARMTKTMMITVGGVTLYMVLVIVLVIWYRVRNERRKAAALIYSQNGSKPDISGLEMKERSIKLKADPDTQSTEDVRESLKNSIE
ncbi:tyrosine-protein kinase-like otk [Tetranychus urticae]|uniref:tyrosine-protein kinase-like otk n=1 Tax=Tetranychus urticae TaxID=32264 RepID=UPI00077BEBA1|nr:tyrosine-protein kinase-like otk [Tetranychus urticae]XP_015792872.1 tyrosine-protein kinase-like otk [Tetranychus urticae]